ncbi:DUF4142 domain-containing protein [Sinorhizobium medicae]|uniref:DUF4142 domain-containing protein n=1 Tax=Sinorhizobium medicae TaxID=110321 RepID=UPI000C7C5483|nr:DUF4142 domain-containing protein [Sinorhizobium medicae]PLU58297.1 DUF305 domain-containing protein [Sinorhizobium medicae]
MRTVNITLAAIMLCFVSIQAVSAQTKPTEPQEFARKMSMSNLFELKSAELARQRGEGRQVLEFAERMLADHARAGKELAEAARKDGVELSQSLDKAGQERLAALQALNGATFDPAYLSSQVTAHEDALELLKTYAERGEAGALKAFAESAYPTVRTHLLQVQSITSP